MHADGVWFATLPVCFLPFLLPRYGGNDRGRSSPPTRTPAKETGCRRPSPRRAARAERRRGDGARGAVDAAAPRDGGRVILARPGPPSSGVRTAQTQHAGAQHASPQRPTPRRPPQGESRTAKVAHTEGRQTTSGVAATAPRRTANAPCRRAPPAPACPGRCADRTVGAPPRRVHRRQRPRLRGAARRGTGRVRGQPGDPAAPPIAARPRRRRGRHPRHTTPVQPVGPHTRHPRHPGWRPARRSRPRHRVPPTGGRVQGPSESGQRPDGTGWREPRWPRQRAAAAACPRRPRLHTPLLGGGTHT